MQLVLSAVEERKKKHQKTGAALLVPEDKVNMVYFVREVNGNPL